MECLKSWMGCWWSNLPADGVSEASMAPHLLSRDTVFQRNVHLMNERQELIHLNSWVSGVDERYRMVPILVSQLKELAFRNEETSKRCDDLSKRYEELSKRYDDLSLRVENDDLVIVTTEM